MSREDDEERARAVLTAGRAGAGTILAVADLIAEVRAEALEAAAGRVDLLPDCSWSGPLAADIRALKDKP